MRIRIVQPAHGETDGVNLETFRRDFMYDVPPSLGSYLIAAGAAELVASDEPALLVPFSELSRGVFHRLRDIADDRGRPREESMFTFEWSAPHKPAKKGSR